MTIHEPRIARKCCEIMRQHNFKPQTLINIGVGRCPEYEVWKAELPGTRLIGIDARARAPFWGGEYIHAALSDEEQVINYCGRCRHSKCIDPNHRNKWHAMLARGLDKTLIEAVDQQVIWSVESPLFIWMDIDGAELEVMRGGDWTFRHAKFVNCELRNFSFAPWHAKQVQSHLERLGYTLCHAHEGTDDVLFVRK